nr:protein Skeletor, isoforms B/C-like [Procambarus clarkii]
MSWPRLILLVFLGFSLHGLTLVAYGQERDRKRGAKIGPLRTLQHNVAGTVFAVDEDKLYIENFTYDGVGPDAFFWIGNGSQPSPKGHLIRYPLDSTDGPGLGFVCFTIMPDSPTYSPSNPLSLPQVDFGHVTIPKNLEPPRKRLLPEFHRLAHGLKSGNISILDARTFYIPNLHYDGLGPDAYFWVGKGTHPDPKGQKIPNEMGSLDVLRAYEGEDIELQLPENLTVYDIDYLGVWCVTYKHNFGHVQIPRPEELWVPPALGQTRIKLDEDLGVQYSEDEKDTYQTVDSKLPEATTTTTITTTNFERQPPHKHREDEIYDHETRHQAAGSRTDIDSGSDSQAGSNTGSGHSNKGGASFLSPSSHLLLVLPLTLVLLVPLVLGSTPVAGSLVHITPEFDNCRQLSDDLQVEWRGKEEEVHIRLSAKMAEDQYIAFGISPTSGKPEMLNSDIVVAYYDKDDGSFHAVDYSVTAKSQCDGTYGVCPDERVNGRNDASVIGGERRNGVTSITFSRPYETNDQLDMPISRYADPITVIAAIGQLNTRKEANYHDEFVTKNNVILDFTSVEGNSCTSLVGSGHETQHYQPWSPIILQNITNFTATIGPTGGYSGYSAITHRTYWGIAWWINDKLIPEIYVKRGQTYYFSVSGGNDHTNNARYHPLYITSSPEGGFQQKTAEEQTRERIFAGVSYSKMGTPEPTAAGDLCEWQHTAKDAWEDSLSIDEYKDTLYKKCDGDSPGLLVWTVEEDTPDLVYYQCYNHRNMGWKIHVFDSGYKLRQEGDNGGSSKAPLHHLAPILLVSFVFFLR